MPYIQDAEVKLPDSEYSQPPAYSANYGATSPAATAPPSYDAYGQPVISDVYGKKLHFPLQYAVLLTHFQESLLSHVDIHEYFLCVMLNKICFIVSCGMVVQ